MYIKRGTIGTSGKQLSPFSVEYLLSLEQQSQYMSTDGIEKRKFFYILKYKKKTF